MTPFLVINTLMILCFTKQCSVKDLTQNVADFNNSLSHKALRSLKSNLALNPVETTCKSMLLSTSQIASFVGLTDENHKLEISNRQLERVSEQGYWE